MSMTDTWSFLILVLILTSKPSYAADLISLFNLLLKDSSFKYMNTYSTSLR